MRRNNWIFYWIPGAMLLLGASSCSRNFIEIGRAQVYSTSEINTQQEYVQLKNSTGASRKELDQWSSQTIDAAVNKAVSSVDRGHFLRNVVIYTINGTAFTVQGEVWGLPNYLDPNPEAPYRVGDRVTYPREGATRKARIVEIESSEFCIVEEENGSRWRIEFFKLSPASK